MFSDVLGAFLCFSDFSRNPRPKALGVRVRLCCCGPWWLLCQRWRTGIRKCALRPLRPPKPWSKAGQVGQVGRLESLSLAEPNISLISSPNIQNLQFLDFYTIPDQRADLMLMMLMTCKTDSLKPLKPCSGCSPFPMLQVQIPLHLKLFYQPWRHLWSPDAVLP